MSEDAIVEAEEALRRAMLAGDVATLDGLIADGLVFTTQTGAVVGVRMAAAGTFEGAPFAGAFRYTRVWAAGPGGWRVVAGHVSPVPP